MSRVLPTDRENRPLEMEVLSMDVLNARLHTKRACTMRNFWMHFADLGSSRVIAGLVFTLLLHLLVFSSVLLGTSGRPLKPITIEGASETNSKSNADKIVTALILIDERGLTSEEAEPISEMPDDLAHESDDPIKLVGVTVSTPPEPSGSEGGKDENAPLPDVTGDETGRAVMFGRYMGQIKARIERAWSYPVSSSTDSFNCKVQIKQDRQGKVLEVMLVKCSEDPAWQLSLVQAIDRASPLSSPPVESVFTEMVTLTFDAAGIPQLMQAANEMGEPLVVPDVP